MGFRLATDTCIGVIPRAAKALFRKLQRPPGLNRSESSNLRVPTRYSMISPQSSSQNIMTLAKRDTENDWQLKATYVEVVSTSCSSEDELTVAGRYTMSNFGIY